MAESGSPEEARTRAPGQGSALNLKSRFEVARVPLRSSCPGESSPERMPFSLSQDEFPGSGFLSPITRLDRTHLGPEVALPQGTPGLYEPHPVSGEATRPDFALRPAAAKRHPSTGDDPTSASGSVPRWVRLAASCPRSRGSNQTRPLTSEAAGLRDETRSTREQRGQRRRVYRHQERDMAGKMTANNMQTESTSVLEDGTDLRNAARMGHSLRFSADSQARGAGSSSRTGTPPVKHESAHGQPRRNRGEAAPTQNRGMQWFGSARADLETNAGSRTLFVRIAASFLLVAGLVTAIPAQGADHVQRARPFGQDADLDELHECRNRHQRFLHGVRVFRRLARHRLPRQLRKQYVRHSSVEDLQNSGRADPGRCDGRQEVDHVPGQ